MRDANTCYWMKTIYLAVRFKSMSYCRKLESGQSNLLLRMLSGWEHCAQNVFSCIDCIYITQLKHCMFENQNTLRGPVYYYTLHFPSSRPYSPPIASNNGDL